MTDNYNELKRRAIERFFSGMNPQQLKAIFKIRGPLLILAGAGSGKTTVLINRIANMIYFGSAYTCESGNVCPEEDMKFLEDFADGRSSDSARLSEKVGYDRIDPWKILAITFTNKAAGELQERLAAMLGDEYSGVTAATFHSLCVRILRREAEHLGFARDFTIYDSDDSLRVMKNILKELDISDKMFPPRMVLAEISHQKDMMISPEEYISQNGGDYRCAVIGKLYRQYQKKLKDAQAMDFDDLICHTVTLFTEFPDVLDHYQNRYRYVMVDEYQDTNAVQFRLVAMLSAKYGNLCVVGDDDQSIYRFRGATIENILSFEDAFSCDPQTDVIRLEQNYRSTQNILTCANKLILNNKGRKGKNLWTDSGDGDKVIVYRTLSEKSEAQFIAEKITAHVESGGKFSDLAVLYRMNAQSNAIEQLFMRSSIPYRIFGGTKFYDRKEIKDITAYLSVISNHWDILRLRRIINEPKRGIGEATAAYLEQICSDLGLDPITVMLSSESYAPLQKRSKQLRSLGEMFAALTDLSENEPLEDLLDDLLEMSGYKEYQEKQGEEGAARLENIDELKSTMADYESDADEPTLSGFLEEIALYTELDRYDENGDYVSLMTIHSAKGLEFDTVFTVGMEEKIFPSARSSDNPEDIEEERRLAYVAITRAKKHLYLTYATSRMLFGRTEYNHVSRFIKELPEECIEEQEDMLLSAQKEQEKINRSVRSGISLQQQMALRNSSQSGETQQFSAGDRVLHRIFGEGMILSAVEMGGDTLLEIAFDTKGTKKIFANFARLVKLK